MANDFGFDSQPARSAHFAALGEVCRLGLASRGNTNLSAEAVEQALDRGINYLNWCGYPDGLSAAVRRLAKRRNDIRVAVQLESRTKREAEREIAEFLGELGTNYLDAVTYYYVEHRDEWRQIISPGGAAEALEAARAAGRVRSIGLTSHQRPLAATIAESGRLNFLMIRYNAAHRGAERDVFPTTRRLGLPTVAFTALRWGALLEATGADPPGFVPPSAPECYQFVLAQPAVTVALMAPDSEAELAENLSLLDDWRGLTQERHAQLAAHGRRVRHTAGQFP